MNDLKGIITVLLIGLMQACSSLSPLDMSYSGPTNPAFTEALAEQDWIRDEYTTYQKRKGYKAFAIAKDAGGTIFADDKVTEQAAYNEALRMCRHYSEGDGQCSVIDEQGSQERSGLTQKQIDTAPKELIAHRDIVRYVKYKKSHCSQSICSGSLFWAIFLVSQPNYTS
jgi:hypothetical protein